jgi:hypothetical protein
MTKKEISKAAEDNSMNYCIQRGMAKAAFIDGALWALKEARKMMIEFTMELEDYEKEM